MHLTKKSTHEHVQPTESTPSGSQDVRIQKVDNTPPTDLEETIAKELEEFVNRNKDLDYSMGFYIESATGFDDNDCKAVVIYYPFKLLKIFREAHDKLVAQLESNFVGNNVFLMPRRNLEKSPKHRYLLVFDALMSDIVHPTEIIGKRLVWEAPGFDDGFIEYFLELELEEKSKLDTFAYVFNKLCEINQIPHVDIHFKIPEA